ncbi:LysR family transcriptional regulator [Burkholderiaceae bacterium DAT-1]|nr:LysR family transcriptional regulator [Burkholderiaceae bacterium DAT-1]
MHLELDALRALDMVIREGSVARAAERLHKAQSAVSYQLRRLEEQLGVALLDRSAYRIRLTPAGETLLGEGRKLLAQAGQIESLARQFSEGWEARLTVVIDGIMPLNTTLKALKALADKHVPTRVQLKIEFLWGVQHRFEGEGADLMLVKDYEPQALWEAESLEPIECVLCVAPDHPLAHMDRVTLDDLHDHVELSVQDSSGRGDDRHSFGGERIFHLSGFVAKKQALLMGLGFGWMPTYLIEDELQSGELRELAFEAGSRYSFTPFLVHRRDRPPGPACKLLMSLLRSGIEGVQFGG